MDDTLPWIIAGGATLWLLVVLGLLWDLRRNPVQHLPKWAWALIIVLVSFPIGPILYLALGRAHRETGLPAARPDAPPPPQGPWPDRQAPAGVAATADAVTSQVPAITTTALTKAYGDTLALDRVDLAVPRGATYGLIGPNGAGKTTVLSILAGLRHPTSGSVTLGVDRARIAVLVDTPVFEPWLTAREVVDLARDLVAPGTPGDRVDAALERVGLAASAGRRTGGFSRGMLQRLGLATCLVGDPQVLVLDEPSSALDPAGRREVLDLIGRLATSATVVLSTHILADVQQVCDVVGLLDHGRLRYQGPIDALLAQTSSAYTLHLRGPAAGLAELLGAQPWVSSVEEVGEGRIRLVTDDARQAELAVPRILAERGLALVSFNPATDLETAFLELTT